MTVLCSACRGTGFVVAMVPVVENGLVVRDGVREFPCGECCGTGKTESNPMWDDISDGERAEHEHLDTGFHDYEMSV